MAAPLITISGTLQSRSGGPVQTGKIAVRLIPPGQIGVDKTEPTTLYKYAYYVEAAVVAEVIQSLLLPDIRSLSHNGAYYYAELTSTNPPDLWRELWRFPTYNFGTTLDINSVVVLSSTPVL